MFRRLRIASAALLLLLCSCQSAVQEDTSVAPTIYTTQPPVNIAQSTGSPVTPTPEASDDLPALLSYSSESLGFITHSIDEFEMMMIDRMDLRREFGLSLSYYMPTHVPEGFSFESASCSSFGIGMTFLGPGVRYEENFFKFRAMLYNKQDLLKNTEFCVEEGLADRIYYKGQNYYVSKIIPVSPNDDDDTPGIKPQSVSICWYDDALGQSFEVLIPDLTSFDPSLFRYCEFKTVVIDPERIDRLRSELLKNYTHEFPVNPERIAAEADFAARDYDTFIEMFRQRADIREAYKCPLTEYKPIWQPPGYELEQICCGRLGRAFLYRKGTSSIIHMAYNRYRNDFLRQLQQYENEGRMERHELEHINGCCYVMASELSAGIDIYRYDERWKQAIYVHMPADEYDPSMLDLYCAFSMVEME